MNHNDALNELKFLGLGLFPGLPERSGDYSLLLRAEDGEEQAAEYFYEAADGHWYDRESCRIKGVPLTSRGCGGRVQGWRNKQYEEMQLAGWRERLAIYKDGSGSALGQWLSNIQTVEKRLAVLRVKMEFLKKHAETLNGLYWRVGYLDAEIELSWSVYRGEKTTPGEVAALWPGAQWRRTKQDYGDATKRDWVAVVDGVTLRIVSAESYEPVYIPEDGPVRVPGMKRGAGGQGGGNHGGHGGDTECGRGMTKAGGQKPKGI